MSNTSISEPIDIGHGIYTRLMFTVGKTDVNRMGNWVSQRVYATDTSINVTMGGKDDKEVVIQLRRDAVEDFFPDIFRVGFKLGFLKDNVANARVRIFPTFNGGPPISDHFVYKRKFYSVSQPVDIVENILGTLYVPQKQSTDANQFHHMYFSTYVTEVDLQDGRFTKYDAAVQQETSQNKNSSTVVVNLDDTENGHTCGIMTYFKIVISDAF